jgi:DNA-binding FadR family transcriptional regulator
MRFHNAIAAATHNDVLRDLVEHLVTPTHQAINAAITDPARSNSDHRLILEALRRHDPTAARDIMASHVSHFGEVQMPRL